MLDKYSVKKVFLFGSLFVYSCTYPGKNTPNSLGNTQNFKILNETCSNDTYEIGSGYSDDTTYFSLNGDLVLTSFSTENKTKDITNYLISGENTVNFDLYNHCQNCGGQSKTSWNFWVKKNGEQVFSDSGSGFGPDGFSLAHSNSFSFDYKPCPTPTPTPTPTPGVLNFS